MNLGRQKGWSERPALQIFSLNTPIISLMVVILLASWWLVSMGPVAGPPNGSETASSTASGREATHTAPQRANYGEALDGARGAADALGD